MPYSAFPDLWEYLKHTNKHVVMYGMGNGADKILAVAQAKGIEIEDFFASDGFVRGHSFHGKKVLSWSETKEKYGAENLVVLLSFGTSRPEVLETVYRVAREAELYAPDVPAFGDGVFDRAFFEVHRDEIEAVYGMLADNESKNIYRNVIAYKLTGNIEYLRNAESDRTEMMLSMVDPERLRVAADLGAYNGDTVRELLSLSNGGLARVYAMEPDARNFRKLQAYTESETRAEILPIHAGAWSESATLCFDASGNRNASFEVNRSESLADRPAKTVEMTAKALDDVLNGEAVDYIKYDVEGAEREALLGSRKTITAHMPTLLVSLYHRNEDVFALPLLVREQFPRYQHFYVRRLCGIPAWDLNLFCKK